MPLAPDDHVIVDSHPHVPPGLGKALGDLDVGAARLGASRGVVVHHPTTCFIILKCKHFF